jgi:hypothetical protein
MHRQYRTLHTQKILGPQSVLRICHLRLLPAWGPPEFDAADVLSTVRGAPGTVLGTPGTVLGTTSLRTAIGNGSAELRGGRRGGGVREGSGALHAKEHTVNGLVWEDGLSRR